MNRIQCPCCKYFTVESDDEVIVDICDVCFWQYDLTSHMKPDQISGANKISLNEAIQNYREFGVSKPQRKHLVRAPLEEELPENNN